MESVLATYENYLQSESFSDTDSELDSSFEENFVGQFVDEIQRRQSIGQSEGWELASAGQLAQSFGPLTLQSTSHLPAHLKQTLASLDDDQLVEYIVRIKQENEESKQACEKSTLVNMESQLFGEVEKIREHFRAIEDRFQNRLQLVARMCEDKPDKSLVLEIQSSSMRIEQAISELEEVISSLHSVRDMNAGEIQDTSQD